MRGFRLRWTTWVVVATLAGLYGLPATIAGITMMASPHQADRTVEEVRAMGASVAAVGVLFLALCVVAGWRANRLHRRQRAAETALLARSAPLFTLDGPRGVRIEGRSEGLLLHPRRGAPRWVPFATVRKAHFDSSFGVGSFVAGGGILGGLLFDAFERKAVGIALDRVGGLNVHGSFRGGHLHLGKRWPLESRLAVARLMASQGVAVKGLDGLEQALKPAPVVRTSPGAPLPAGRGPGAAIAACAAVALGGVALWAAIAWATGLELGILAAVMGATCGYAMFRVSGRRRSVSGGLWAVGLALVGIVVGHALAVLLVAQRILAQQGLSVPWGTLAAQMAAHPGDLVDPFSAIFSVIAVAAAWRIAGGRKDVAYVRPDAPPALVPGAQAARPCPFCKAEVVPARDAAGRLVCPVCHNSGSRLPLAPEAA